ncbi:MAG: GNAT family N-acetyltransferase [Pseudomonadota bacterium]
MAEGFVIRPGFPESLRAQMGAIYFEAFAGKIGWPLGGTDLGPEIIAGSLDPRFALTAVSRDGARALGIAGFKTGQGALVNRLEEQMRARFRGMSLLWRLAVLSVLERDLPEDQLLLDGIAVHAEARGMGVGTALLTAVEAEARRRKLSGVRLDVIDGNPRARALYQRRGYLAEGTSDLGPLRHLFGFRRATSMCKAV